MSRRDEGSATILVVGVIGAVVAILLGALALVSAAEASSRARAAADLGALAGADQLVNHGVREPCSAAQQIVRANGGAVLTCRISGTTIEVVATVPTSWPGLGPARARSRAGPAPGT